MQEDSQTSNSGKTQQQSIPKTSLTLTSCVLDSHVKRFLLQGKGVDLKIQEVHYFLKSQELLKKNCHLFYCLKTSEGYSITTKGKHLPQSLQSWKAWGIRISDGLFLTAKTSVCHKTENVSLLSDILETDVPERYYLSEEMTRKLMDHKSK